MLSSLSCLSVLNKQKHWFFTLIIVEILICGFINRYYFNNSFTQLWFNLNDTNHPLLTTYKCTSMPYPETYYRKRMYYNTTKYYTYAISIGKIFSKYLTPNETQQYGIKIRNNLIQTHGHLIINGSLSQRKVIMHQRYLQYYYNFHNPSNSTNTTNSTIPCPPNNTIDFFEFIQVDGQYTNDTNIAPINFYALKSIEHVFGGRGYAQYHSSKPNALKNKTHYILPKLFSYTVSAEETGDLMSLELRFAEIIDVSQHDVTRHMLLNGVNNKLLWAGEFYYIYDQKYKKYIVIMDTASGHFKPNIAAIPEYLERILLDTLFPYYRNIRNNTQNKYRPLMMIGFRDKPWNVVKKILFPMVHEINVKDTTRLLGSRKYRKEKLDMFFNNKSCYSIIKECGKSVAKQMNHTLKSSMKWTLRSIWSIGVNCVKNGTNGGWKGLTDLKALMVYRFLHKYLN